MSVTKLKIFKIEISDNGKFDFNSTAQNEINKFLGDSNIVYLNHSTSVLNLPKDEYTKVKYINKFLVVTLFYKDLADTEMDLSKVSKKSVAVVKRSIEAGENLKTSVIETEFDKKMKKILQKKSDQKLLDEKNVVKL